MRTTEIKLSGEQVFEIVKDSLESKGYIVDDVDVMIRFNRITSIVSLEGFKVLIQGNVKEDDINE